MPRKPNYDKYGYELTAVSRDLCKNKLIITMYYSGDEYFQVQIPCEDNGLIKNILKQLELKDLFQEKTCACAIGYGIKKSYETIFNFDDKLDLEEYLLYDVPKSIILNNDAISEILSNLPSDNKHLITFVGDVIKKRREEIIKVEKKNSIMNDQISKQFNNLKEEFGF